MSALTLALLGPFECWLDGKPLTTYRTSRAQALLVYLATESALGAAQAHREALMELLWPGMPPDSGRVNLRQNLYYLRQSIPPARSTGGDKEIPLIISEHQTVALNADYPLEFDVQRFGNLLAGPQEDWDRAIALYRGDFLSDFYLADTNPFEEWVAARRAAFRRQMLDALRILTDSLVNQGLWRDAERYARQQLAIDPLGETAYRQLMEVLYWSGRRAEALRVYLECVRILEQELNAPPSESTSALADAIREETFADRREMSARGTGAEAEPGYRQQRTSGTLEEKPDSSAAPEQTHVVRHNLPVALTPFVGREHELAELSKLITNPEVHIITIFGPGGIGKTRLAREVAGRQRHPASPFPDGVFFISLAPLESPGEIVTTLATVLGLSFLPASSAAGSEREQILHHLARKNMLLVMDNFEHLLAGRDLLAEISRRAAGVKLLVTSRERLQMRGEQVFPLHGLEMPKKDGSEEEAPIDYAAARLFLNVSRRAVPDFALFAGDAAQILRICHLVEGMPLGLELAASWTGLLPLSKIAGEIEQSMELLRTEHHDVPERHRSIQATLGVSWKRLTAEQKRAFEGLTVFHGGFSRAAARHVAGADLTLLSALVNKSWLSYERKHDRYQIHELLRQYGSNILKRETALDQEVRKRHSAYFCAFLKERESDWFGPRQQAATAEVRHEIRNIESAWAWAAGRGDVRLLAQAYVSLGRFYSREMRRTAGKEAFRLAADRLWKLIAQPESSDAQCLALLSQILAWQAHFADEVTQKQRILVQSQDILDRVSTTEQDTRAEQAFVFLEQASATEKRDYEASIRFSELAMELFRALRDRTGEAQALKELGLNYRRLGKIQQAIGALRENLDIRQQLNDPLGIADAMHWLGVALMYQLNLREAEQLLRQAFGLFRQLESRYYEASTLSVLSFLQMHAGDPLAAKELVEKGLALEREFGLVVNLWLHYASVASKIDLGHYAEAEAEASFTLDIAKQRGLTEEIASGLEYLAAIALAQGDLERAKDYAQKSLVVYRDAADVAQFRVMIGILGYVARMEGDDWAARKHLKDALCAVAEYEYTELAWDCLLLAALLAADNGQPERSVELVSLVQQVGYSKNSQFYADVAGRELEDVRNSLPPEVAAAAEARGRALDVQETLDKLLADFSGLPSG